MALFFYRIFQLLFLIALPFWALIRGSLWLQQQYHLSPWAAILGGVGISALVIFIYIVYWQGRKTGKLGDRQSLQRQYLLVFSLVMVYCLPGLFSLSAANAKHESVRQEFRSLHPILRLGISTLIFLDRDLLITDADRLPEDYRRMGLPTKARSKHYRQPDGFAHAVDIRTIGHSSSRNFLIKTYFEMMGFRTLRHVGTADHLHVELAGR